MSILQLSNKNSKTIFLIKLVRKLVEPTIANTLSQPYYLFSQTELLACWWPLHKYLVSLKIKKFRLKLFSPQLIICLYITLFRKQIPIGICSSPTLNPFDHVHNWFSNLVRYVSNVSYFKVNLVVYINKCSKKFFVSASYINVLFLSIVCSWYPSKQNCERDHNDPRKRHSPNFTGHYLPNPKIKLSARGRTGWLYMYVCGPRANNLFKRVSTSCLWSNA